MSGIITGMVVATVPLLMLRAISFSRWRLWVLGPVLMVALGVSYNYGIVTFSDLWVLPAHLGMSSALVLTILWIVFGAVARAQGPVSIPGPAWVTAMLMGAAIGEIPAAAVLSAGARNPRGAAKLALASAGGGMMGRLGDPATLILLEGHSQGMLWMAPLGVLLAWLARPSDEDLVHDEPAQPASIAMMIVFVALAAIPGLTFGILIFGILMLGVMAQRRAGQVDIGGSIWQISAVILAVVAVAGGAPEQAAVGLELILETLDWWASPLLVAAAALLTALTDATAMAIVCQSIVGRAMALDPVLIVTPMTMGVAVGGLGPLLVAGALRAGWRLWLAQVSVAIVWGCIWAVW